MLRIKEPRVKVPRVKMPRVKLLGLWRVKMTRIKVPRVKVPESQTARVKMLESNCESQVSLHRLGDPTPKPLEEVIDN